MDWSFILWPSFILVVAIISDLKLKKVPNKVVMALLVASFLVLALHNGLQAFSPALFSLGLATVLFVPLVLLKIVGGGDFKIFLVFSLLLPADAIFQTLVYSLIWGALLGFFQVLFQKDLINLFKNIKAIITLQSQKQKLSLHKIPFTVALGFGWLSYLVPYLRRSL
ncbi:MAG: hypothetical protein D6797_01275 [Bdellovibrio sp.]|nr:MAG: hypothetical protein D6797_01275 [Bdellovibrio sp.]